MPIVPESPDPEPLLAGFEECVRGDAADFFQPGAPVTVARAPARIDCMGGIADYCGSVVFEGTLGRAAVVGFQPRRDGILRARTVAPLGEIDSPEAVFRLEDLRTDGRMKGCEELARVFAADPATAWAAYVLGGLAVFELEGVARLQGGANVLLWSDIPIGVGVASSAALEVAAMHAAATGLGLQVPGARLAELAQVVENRIVGAPCGIMDQVTSALGEENRLLALRCQPCQPMGQHRLPDGVRVFGLSSRVQHRVSGAAYTQARVAAFMGLKIITTEMQRRGTGEPELRYLCNLDPAEYRQHWRPELPDCMTGAEFLRAYGETVDTVTTVRPDVIYRVRACTDHPVFENYRVNTFMACIDRARAGDRTALVEAGGLMYASHWSYGWNCHLGSAQTDLLVDLARAHGPDQGIYGAKITGGGSGGTVAVLADGACEALVHGIAAEYAERTGIRPDIFDRTSPGAYAFGTRQYHVKDDNG